jgi:GrpB-like predicted nucleotidyltransferase (UPF0157 family)
MSESQSSHTPSKFLLTPTQQKWVEGLNDTDHVKIIPFDVTAQEKFEKVKLKIHAELGEDIVYVHSGATSLGISGQDEIDTYIPIDVKFFDMYIQKLSKIFGPPRKIYPEDRAHFKTYEDGKRVDIYLINKDAPSWTEGVKFNNYLKTHSDQLEKYKILKESAAGLSTREYYRKKLEFINEILSLAGN